MSRAAWTQTLASAYQPRHDVTVSSPEWQTPPPRLPKRRNALLRYYDLPIYADWTAWSTLFWTALGGLSVGLSNEQDPSAPTMPNWVGGPLAAVLLGFLFGLAPAMIRLALRRRRAGRRSAAATPIDYVQRSAMGAGPPPPVAPTARPPMASAVPPSDRRPVPPPPPQASTPPPADATTPPTRPSRWQQFAPISSTPVGALDVDAMARSVSLSNARQALHYPIARAARAIQLAADRRVQYEAILEAGEALTVTLGISVTAWLRATGVAAPSLADLYVGFVRGGVSQGRWLAVLNDVRSIVANDNDVLAGLREATLRGKGGSGLLADLDVLLQERNRWAHGARPRSAIEAGLRVLEIGPALERAIDKVLPFAQSPWLLTQTSSFQRDRMFSVSALRAMGDHPEFERTHFESATPLLDETFYLITSRGPIDLTPLVVMRYCETCRQPEVCYADKLDDKHGLALKTFANGHVIFDPDLAPDLRTLLGPGQSQSPPSAASH
jgi:hypothetical protein